MPNLNNTAAGKAGTMTVADFETLAQFFSSYGPKLLAQKVAKICLKNAAVFLHENSASLVGNAYKLTASKITDALGEATGRGSIVSSETFKGLEGMCNRYGAEVVVWKLGKLSARKAKYLSQNGGTTTEITNYKSLADSLKGIFPRAE